MKIVITVTSPTFDSEVDPRFGRGAYQLVVDLDTLEWVAQSNPGVTASGGAGITAAQFVTGLAVDAVISGDFGPHAFQALDAANLPMYMLGNCRTVREVVAQFNAGQLLRAGTPTREDRHVEGQG